MNRFAVNDEAESFDDMGPILVVTPGGCHIRGGHVWKAPTAKGSYNYIISMRVIKGWMYYIHGDKVKKVSVEKFCQCVDDGEFDRVKYSQMDAERLNMSMIGLDAIANRRTYEDSIKVSEDEMEAAFNSGAI
jgi:hypothetical protein